MKHTPEQTKKADKFIFHKFISLLSLLLRSLFCKIHPIKLTRDSFLMNLWHFGHPLVLPFQTAGP
ncbi:MAG: hypothetical protein LUI87_00030, partial [Lachnospiraceae bacterium]|nr:hypothetical protein [Lachnospiraceae bacterium]